MIKYIFIPFGILASATAQMFMKKASGLSIKDFLFYIYFGSAGLSYVFSFVLYTLVLKYFPISKISPVMTLGTMIIVILLGIFMFQENLTFKQIIGITFGAIAIILIVS